MALFRHNLPGGKASTSGGLSNNSDKQRIMFAERKLGLAGPPSIRRGGNSESCAPLKRWQGIYVAWL